MATPKLHLYYWVTSSASQKALLALTEAKLAHTKTVVNLMEGEQNSAWYMRINPAGMVPVLQIGDRYVADSEAIYDAIAELAAGKTSTVPDPKTPEGELVQHWRKRLYGVNIMTLTFGTLCNPQHADGPLNVPKVYLTTQEQFKARMDKTVSQLEAIKAKNPDLKEAIDKKIEHCQRMATDESIGEDALLACKSSLDKMFDDIETQLRKSRTENIVEHWLCGPNFTVADMTLVMLIGRLKMINSFDRYVNAEHRPAVLEYWQAACRRPSVQSITLNAKNNLAKYYVARTVKRVAVGSVAAGGVVALAAFIAHKYRS